ncbi:potassium transporter TrkH, partial [Pseudomonas sp. 5C2]|nr:potassium transporter TrkH [Pseudomonas sp. 5C2]
MAMPTLRIIGFIIGIFLITLAIAMLTLLIFDHTSDIRSFLCASLITFVVCLALVIPGRPEHIH